MAPLMNATEESSSQLWSERAVNTAGYVGAIAYGLHIAIYSIASYFIFTSRRSRHRWRQQVFNAFIFALGTIRIATVIWIDQEAWVIQRNYPGGPAAYLKHAQLGPVAIFGLCCGAFAGFTLMGLMLWRTYVVWDTWIILIVPTILFVSAIVFTCADIVHSIRPLPGHWGPDLGIACWSITAATVILLTALIALRIIYQRRKMLRSGVTATGGDLMGVISMLIESMAPAALIFLVFIILYAMQDGTDTLLLPAVVQAMCISQHLMLIQVYRGRVWSTRPPMSSVRFDHHDSSSEAPIPGDVDSNGSIKLESDDALENDAGSQLTPQIDEAAEKR